MFRSPTPRSRPRPRTLHPDTPTAHDARWALAQRYRPRPAARLWERRARRRLHVLLIVVVLERFFFRTATCTIIDAPSARSVRIDVGEGGRLRLETAIHHGNACACCIVERHSKLHQARSESVPCVLKLHVRCCGVLGAWSDGTSTGGRSSSYERRPTLDPMLRMKLTMPATELLPLPAGRNRRRARWVEQKCQATRWMTLNHVIDVS